MSDKQKTYGDIDTYIAAMSDEERQELAIADIALDLAWILYHARQERGLTQSEAAKRAGLKQQAISRLEKAANHVQFDTLQRYLGALGYTIDIVVKDRTTGDVVAQTSLSPA
jgi:DNA-binding XRE family transcriptional regulator